MSMARPLASCVTFTHLIREPSELPKSLDERFVFQKSRFTVPGGVQPLKVGKACARHDEHEGMKGDDEKVAFVWLQWRLKTQSIL